MKRLAHITFRLDAEGETEEVIRNEISKNCICMEQEGSVSWGNQRLVGVVVFSRSHKKTRVELTY